MPVPLARDPTLTTATLCSPVPKRRLQHHIRTQTLVNLPSCPMDTELPQVTCTVRTYIFTFFCFQWNIISL